MSTLFLKIAINSLIERKGSVLLTLLVICLSVFVLLGVEQIRDQTKQNFNRTITGTDMIVGGRTGDINLLLYSVFQMGAATQNMSWQSYQKLANHKDVSWAVPISLGDSHKGYRVTATTADYFKFYQYADNRMIEFAKGKAFEGVYGVVLGAEVAKKLNYQLQDKIILSHGLVSTEFNAHKDNKFQVTGILKPTGTPVDRSLYISLAGMEAIHIGWQNGVQLRSKIKVRETDIEQLQPKSITAALIGLKHKMATFRLQREINQNAEEALLAILPGVTLAKIWSITGAVEQSLQLIAALIIVSSLLGLSAMLLASIQERQREIALMRAMGAHPWFIFILIEMEVLLMTVTGYIMAVFGLFASFSLARQWVLDNYGVVIASNLLDEKLLIYLAVVVVMALIVGTIPALMAYKRALNTRLS